MRFIFMWFCSDGLYQRVCRGSLLSMPGTVRPRKLTLPWAQEVPLGLGVGAPWVVFPSPVRVGLLAVVALTCRMPCVCLVGILLLDLFLTHFLLHVQNLGLLSRRCIFGIHASYLLYAAVSSYSLSSILPAMERRDTEFSGQRPHITALSCLFYSSWSDAEDSQWAHFPHRWALLR